MLRNTLILLFCFNLLFSIDLYKEIRIETNEIDNLLILSSIGIDVDHIFVSDEFYQFVINEYDLNKLIINNINYSIVHNDIESFYKSRLIQNYEYRDFEYGSMGGYYTFNEIEEQLDQLTNLYPQIISEKVSIGQSLEGREIWGIKISDNPNLDENYVTYCGT